MNYKKLFASFSLLLLMSFGFVSARAQTPQATPSANSSTDEVQSRIRQLETQVEMMREELKRLKESIPSNANGSAQQAVSTSTITVSATVRDEEKEAARQETKPAGAASKPQGIELGSVRAIPYGTIYFNAFGNSGGTNNADVPLFATPTGQGGMSASVRQTRLGLKLEGPKIWNAKSSGVIETDFFGGFPAVGVGETFGVVRVRLAYARLDWERSSLEAGQDWVIFAPVNPVSIAAAAIPQMAAAGNPWTRLPQVRLEQRWRKGQILWQGAVLAPATGDFPAGQAAFFLQPGTGAASRLPYFQSRVSLNDKNWLGLKKPGSIGLSGQYGRARVGNTPGNNMIDATGVALDWNFPLASRVTLAGEAFTGRDLAGFQSGVFQGFNPDFAYRQGVVIISGGPRAIGTRGGWAQLGFTPPDMDSVTLYATFGQDDPRDEDLASVSRRDWRLRNQSFAFSLLYKLSPQFTWGVEFRRFETDYLLSGRQNANHLNLGAAFSF
jgi:hypothetical protein